MTALEWGVRSDPPAPGAVNMAWDETWAAWCPPDRAVLRFYTWERPTLSFGRNEPAVDVYDADGIAERGWDLVRRPTGGRAVLHHRELTYSVIIPMRALGTARETYRAINEGLAAGLQALGVPASLAGDSGADVLALDAGPCFAAPAPGEVVARGRKLVGSAQVRVGRVLLQHGSILLENDQPLVSEVRASTPAAEAEGAVTSLAELVDPVPSREALERALVEGIRSVVSGTWRGVDETFAKAVPGAPGEDFVQRYHSRDWTWRR